MSYDECVKKGLLREITKDRSLVLQTIAMADEDLSEGENSIKNGRYVWGLVQPLMFHPNIGLLRTSPL